MICCFQNHHSGMLSALLTLLCIQYLTLLRLEVMMFYFFTFFFSPVLTPFSGWKNKQTESLNRENPGFTMEVQVALLFVGVIVLADSARGK